MKTETFSFRGEDGAKLTGRLDLPEGPVRATALLAHTFACTPSVQPARRIASRLAEAGIAVLRYDFTGLGGDDGEAAGRAPRVDDLIHAAHALAAREMAPSLLIGHSLAGTAALKAAPSLETLQAVVTLGAPWAHDTKAGNVTARLAEAVGSGTAEVELGGRSLHLSRAFFDEIAAPALTEAVHGLKPALLVMHAPRDAVVGIDNATGVFSAALHPKSFVTLDAADHGLSAPADADYAAGVIAAWAGRYLALDLASATSTSAMPVPPEPAPDGAVRVTEVDPDHYTQTVANGPHHFLLSDEPESVGGSNRGPNPYALLKAALGSCSSMTMRMYARVKKWPVAGISVEVTHEKIKAEDGAKDDRGRPLKIDVFTRHITLEGDLTEEQRTRLVEIADRCPVHKTLHQASRIHTHLNP